MKPDNKESEHQELVDRTSSVFENQKRDIGRLLGEALGEATLDEHDGSAPIGFIAEKITNALSVLDNMEEGESLATCQHDAAVSVGYKYCPDCGKQLLPSAEETEKSRIIKPPHPRKEPPTEEPPIITEEQAAKGLERAAYERGIRAGRGIETPEEMEGE